MSINSLINSETWAEVVREPVAEVAGPGVGRTAGPNNVTKSLMRIDLWQIWKLLFQVRIWSNISFVVHMVTFASCALIWQ